MSQNSKPAEQSSTPPATPRTPDRRAPGFTEEDAITDASEITQPATPEQKDGKP